MTQTTGALTGKVVLVTGASEGIGRAFCLELAAQRPRLALVARNAVRLEELAGECRALGAEALVIPTDVSVAADCQRAVDDTVKAFGALDVLVNNAGITMWASVEEMTDPSLFAKVMDVNYLSVAYCTFYALPHLKRTRGRIVGVSSLAGVIGVPGHACYGASKHAIHGFLNSLRIELMGTGVSVTIVAPDFVATKIHDRGLKGDGTPMRTPLDPAKHMSPETCARLMLAAVIQRKRQLMTSTRGRLAAFARDLIPELMDRIAARQAHKSGLH